MLLVMLVYRRHAVTGSSSITSESEARSELSVDAAQLVGHGHQSGRLNLLYTAVLACAVLP